MTTLGWAELEKRANLTDQQKGSKTCVALRDAALGEEVDSVRVAEEAYGRLGSQFRQMEAAAAGAKQAISRMNKALDLIRVRVEDTRREIKEQSDFIDDKVTRNGIIAYKEILKSTVDVFGADNMTEVVICKAIEEAGYGAWRAMMGPKDERGAARRL